MMNIKHYRVVCWQPLSSKIDDEVFVDIAPAARVIHDVVFYSRLKVLREENPQNDIVDRAGSVYIMDIDDQKEIDIIFDQDPEISRERLIPIIWKTYKRMRSKGEETTLPRILSMRETEKMAAEHRANKAENKAENSDEKEIENIQKFKQKHVARTPQEEQMLLNKEKSAVAAMRKKNALIDRANRDAQQNPILRMKEKMKQYSGD
jgi:hypothetical protein